MYKAAVLGYGVVGSGTAAVLEDNRNRITKAVGSDIILKRILDLRDFPGDRFEDRLTHDFNIILNDAEISVVAETMGGTGKAYEFTKALLEAGKSVVTSNKELVAEKGEELLAIAAKKRVHYLFEASVGGGIPIIGPMINSLEANNYVRIKGILNGTTNYILTMMKDKGIQFGEALANAQKLGYAEKNPDADIKGIDAKRKISILTDIAYGITIPTDKVEATGIDNITPEVMELAESKGCTVKLICYAEKRSDGICIFVSPCAIPKNDPLAGVNDVFNGITFTCDYADEMTFIGRGAGSLPTASAVVGDIITACATAPAEKPLWQSGNINVLGIGCLNTEYLGNTRIPVLI